MANWAITPTTGVRNNNDGTFYFEPNTGTTDIVYTITYKTAEPITYTLKANKECYCKKYNITATPATVDCSGTYPKTVIFTVNQ